MLISSTVAHLKGYLPPEKNGFFRDLGHERTAEVLQVVLGPTYLNI